MFSAMHCRPKLSMRWTATLLVAFVVTLTGCDSVKFYEKRTLASPLMAFDESPTESHFIAKSIYSREGSVGGIGSSAGGGCGCY